MSTFSPNNHELPPLDAKPAGLYQHYKGGWYEVIDTVRCSETLQAMTLYRALYGSFGLWVRPAPMFFESGVFAGKEQPRFVRHDPTVLALGDLPTATAMIAYLRGFALRRSIEIDTALRPPPPAPTTCCGRGCNGCVWESYYTALSHWREDACNLLKMSAQR